MFVWKPPSHSLSDDGWAFSSFKAIQYEYFVNKYLWYCII
jgi:hypothetical protein